MSANTTVLTLPKEGFSRSVGVDSNTILISSYIVSRGLLCVILSDVIVVFTDIKKDKKESKETYVLEDKYRT